ncbi:alpha-2-macroglobulin family protein [Taibaiella helva]|uniref:alpha-2-macroglobulin family protein n=1 Tax=Taibaiella helva TaxID=2301235 RepID=UPI000E56DF03|nr:MG2 domain-containing protein [Taibaiella helva]
MKTIHLANEPRSAKSPAGLALLLSFFLLSCFSSCSNRNEVQVVDKNFDVEVEQQQNLVFRFNKDLYPDSLLNRWDTTKYIEFEPKVAGSFRWNSSSELVFSPASGFRPGVEYKAMLTRHILSKGKKEYRFSKSQVLSFHTAPMKVQQAHTSWMRGRESGNVMVQLDLEFNYETNITEAAAKLKLSANGNPVSYNVVNSGIGKTLSVQLLPLNDKDEEVKLDITLAKGVPIANSKVSSIADTSFSTSIASRFTLAVTDVQAQHTGVEGIVNISLSQPVAEEGLKDKIKIEPAVAFDVTANESGFILTSGEFDPKKTYQVTLSTALEGTFGGKLKEETTKEVMFGELDPAINFINSKGLYLSSKGYRNLALNIVNVPKVEVTVVKVYENNMLQLFRGGSSYGYSYDEDDDYHNYEYYNTQNLGDTVFTTSYDVSKLPKNNAAHLLHLDFSDKLKGYNGVYVITIASSEQKWLQQSKILSLSDIGLILKQEQDKMYVFANSIRNASPLKNVKVSFISTTNQQVYSTETNGDGEAVFENIKEKAPGFNVGMVTAKMGEEYSFIWLDQSRVETSRFDVGGRSTNATGLNAWIYAERSLYRPGETIHASAIVRDESWGQPGEMPVKLRLLMPNGKEFATRRKILDEQGSTETDFAIPHTALTGTYVLQAFTGNDVLLATYNFSIEDFMPDRIKSDLKLNKEDYGVGEEVSASLQADNLFGTPAAGRNYEWELNLDKVAFEPKGYEDYSFDVVKKFSFSTVFRSGKTDASGHVSEAVTLDKDLSETGLLQGNIRATVFDETGRPVHRYARFQVYTQPVFAGIRNFNSYVGTRVPLKIGLIALDRSGRPQAQQLTVSVIRREWQNVIQENGGKYKYVAQWTEKVLQTQQVNCSGSNTVFSYVPDVSGQYEVRVAIAGSSSYVAQSFYAYGHGDTQYASFEVNNEGNVTIKADKESYAPGDAVNLLFTTPFEGRMLVSIERDKVIEHVFLQTENKSASLKLKATDAYLPNVYVSATLFRPMDASDMPLTVAHGFRNIKVEARQNKLPVAVSLTEKSRSKTKQVITVKTVPNAFVTIAAVDEGILQVKNYKTPDPYGYFYQKVALAVNSFDIYPLLLPEYKATLSSTGGDGGDDGQNARVNPLFVNRVKNVSFWSGIRKADGSGTVRYEIDVPQFSGDIRVMAVAYKDKGFGSFDNHMKVADPIVISSALPRFLSPKDVVVMPVTMSNTTTKDARAEVTVTVKGPLGVSGSSSQSVDIKPNSEGRAVFNIVAAAQIGAGTVTVTVKALNETFTNETEIAVRPAASLQKQYQSGTVAAGATVAIPLNANFLPGTLSGSLLVATSPLAQFTKNLSYLVNYPYGCVEQTTSSAFPQLYYTDLVKALGAKDDSDQSPNYNVQQAIWKLQSMQLPNGALSYWPGGNYESWWGSVYAAHFLLEAQRAGFDVNANTLSRLLEYVKFRLKKKEMIEYYFNGKERKSIAAKEIPYSLYVLALARQPQQSTMNYYKGNLSMLSLDGRYLLSAAYALAGMKDQARQVVPPAFTGEKANTVFGGSFYSYTRDRALALNALLDVDPANPQVAELARQLSEELRNNIYLNTQESVFSLLALGKIARRSAGTDAEAQVLAGGKNIGTTKGTPLKIDLKPYFNQPMQLKVTGKGQYYFFRELAGITADGSITEEDKYMKVRRSYYHREGKPIAGTTFRQNDLIVVKLVIAAEYSGEIENVVITDMLPAGLEIENTRLNAMPNMKWITEAKDKDEPDYMDVRDDRLNLFTSVNSTPKTFYYMVRAVSPGTYQLGPVQADAMYNGMYHSYNGAGVVKITE